MSDVLTVLQEHERQALVGQRQSISELVNAVRRYRKAADVLLKLRYSDGEVDSVALYTFKSAIDEIESCEDGRE